jgi:uncharacterized protein (TIGR01777 family)
MRILISGASGLIGTALIASLSKADHEIIRLTRPGRPAGPDAIVWDPSADTIDQARLEEFDVVVHLAGENVAGGRWSRAKKERIRNSRVDGTSLLANGLKGLKKPPKVFVMASATGYYGSRGDEELPESSAPGSGLLADVTREWEAATDVLASTSTRVVKLRIGIVLASKGGALSKMLLPFKLGLGGKFGSGRQYMSWIAMDDLIGIIHHIIANESLSGPVNAVSPMPVTNREFTKTLGLVLRRPTIAAVPSFVLRLAVGEMADEMLLLSARVIPQKLAESGYVFLYPDLEKALRFVLGR